MIVYAYDKETKELIGEITCQESPLEDGVYLFPECYTLFRPKDDKPGFTQIFNGHEWEYKKIVKEKEWKCKINFQLTLFNFHFDFKISHFS